MLRNGNGSDYKTWTRWGRVGVRGQNATLGSGSLADAIKQFERKFKDKSGLTWANRGDEPIANKYAYVERSYNPDSDEEDDEGDVDAGADEQTGEKRKAAESTLEPAVQNLVSFPGTKWV